MTELHDGSVEAYMVQRFDQVGRQMALRARSYAELLAWQAELRARLAAVLGLATFRSCPLDPVVGALVQEPGYTRQHCSIAVEPGIRMPFYALVPAGLAAGERRPVVLAAHGHGGGGKESVAGRHDLPGIAAAIAQYQYDYGVQLVRQGFVVLCPDSRGFGERREPSMLPLDDPMGGSCRVLNNMAMPLGQTVTGMWVWDLMRLADYAATRTDSDTDQIGCVGLSGGGQQALWLAALDQRIQAAVVSGYFYGYKNALLQLNQNCSCNYVPGAWLLADMGDLGALIAPRALFVESGRNDSLNGSRGVANIHEQIEITRAAYRLAGAEDRLGQQVFEGEHRWHGEQAIPWLVDQFSRKQRDITGPVETQRSEAPLS